MGSDARAELITFEEAVFACVEDAELLEAYDTLRGTSLCADIGRAPSSVSRVSHIEALIDVACAVQSEPSRNTLQWFEFFDFVLEHVWLYVARQQQQQGL
jgi:hypothetical protein